MTDGYIKPLPHINKMEVNYEFLQAFENCKLTMSTCLIQFVHSFLLKQRHRQTVKFMVEIPATSLTILADSCWIIRIWSMGGPVGSTQLNKSWIFKYKEARGKFSAEQYVHPIRCSQTELFCKPWMPTARIQQLEQQKLMMLENWAEWMGGILMCMASFILSANFLT